MQFRTAPYLFSIFFFLFFFNSFSQNQETIVVQKPVSEFSINRNSKALGIDFKLNGDKSKLIILTKNQLEIWDTNSRRIMSKKKIDLKESIAKYAINYTGNTYALLKHTKENKKQYSIELYKNQKSEPFGILESSTNNFIDTFTKIKFNRSGDKFAVIHREYGIQIYEIKGNTISILKSISLEKSYFIKIIDFEFSNDNKFFFVLKGNDLTYNAPVIYQKWNLSSYIIEKEVTSTGFDLNMSLASKVGFKVNASSWNLEKGLFANCKFMQSLSRSKRTGNINPNHRSYIELYNATTNQTTNILSHHTVFNETLIVDSETILTSDENRYIYIWDIKTGKCINKLKTDNVNNNEDLDIPLLKPLTRLAIIHIDPKKKEVYYSISEHKTIRVWNYQYNTNEIFQSNLAKVSYPFFTSDSTIIYKRGNYLEHFDYKNQETIDLIRENTHFNIRVSKTRNRFITKTNNSIKLWSIKPFKVLDSIPTQKTSFSNCFTSHNLDYIASTELESAAKAFSSLSKNKKVNSEQLFSDLMKHITNKTYKINGKPDKQITTIKLFKTTNNIHLVDEIEVPSFAISKISFINSKNKILISALNAPVVGKLDFYEEFTNYIYDIKLKTLKTLPKEVNGISEIIPSTNNYFSFKKKNDNIDIKIINSESYKVEKHFVLNEKQTLNNNKVILINNHQVLLSGQPKTILLDLNTGKTQLINNSISHIDFLKKKNLFVTSSNANLSFYHNTLKNKIYDKYYHKDNKSNIIVLPNNYYFNKSKGYELLSLSKNNKIYNFEQFDLKYNRPDIVIESIKETLGDSIINNKELYKLAHKKRLERINKKEEELESGFHTPELTIINKALIPNKTNNSTININIKALDNLYNLEKLQLSVNGVIIKNLTNKLISKKEFSTIVPLKLSNGKNKILISVINEKGISSFKEELNIEYVGLKEISNLFIVSLGVSKYQYLNDTPNSSKDAYTLTEAFKKTSSNTIKRLTLTDNQVTKNSIKQISAFLSQAKENDVILFFVSGHALLKENEYFFCTSNSSLKNITETGINYNDFDELLGNTKSRNRLLILNTCYSGEIFNASTIKEIEAINLMRTVFEDLKLTNGTTVISASEGTNKYYESNTKGNGLITLSILNLINSKKEITVEEFCNEIIQYCTIQNQKDPFNNKLQKNIPLVRHNNIYNNFRIW